MPSPTYVFDARSDSAALAPPTYESATPPFSKFPPEIIALVIIAGGALPSSGQLSRSSFLQTPKESRAFLRMACLVSGEWKATAQKLLFRQAYLFGEFAVRPFIRAVQSKGWLDQITSCTIRSLGKHGDTCKIEALLDNLPNLRSLSIDGKDEYYSKLSYVTKQAAWLRKATRLESLSLYYSSHLLEDQPLVNTLPALHLPNLKRLVVTTGNCSQDVIPLILACPRLESLELCDRSLNYEALAPILKSAAPFLSTLRFNSVSRPTLEALSALRSIVANRKHLTTLTVDVAALHSPSPISPQSSLKHLEMTAGQVLSHILVRLARSSDADREDVQRVVQELRSLRSVAVEESLLSSGLKASCAGKSLELSVVDYGRRA